MACITVPSTGELTSVTTFQRSENPSIRKYELCFSIPFLRMSTRKYLDWHLKPYICRRTAHEADCEQARFSTATCLFRHEREAHRMHNHGIKPFTCLMPGCERAKEGRGFRRGWNQRDHMKRIHEWWVDDNAALEGTGKRRKGESFGPDYERSRGRGGADDGHLYEY